MYYANRKYGWFSDFVAVYRDIERMPYFRLIQFAAGDVLQFDQDDAVPEMHDRIIIGLARRAGAPLITSDLQITAASLAQTVW
jgi:hypothetical protein